MKRIAIISLLSFLLAAMVDGTLHAQGRDTIYIGNQGQTAIAISGSALVVRYYVYEDARPVDAVVRVFRVPLGVRLNWMRKNTYVISEEDLRSLELVGNRPSSSTKAPDHLEYTLHAADFGALRNGQYLAVWDNGNGRSARVYEIGTLGTVWHAAGSTLLVYAVDLKTMKHRSDVQYTLWRDDATHSPLLTFGGLSWLHASAGGSAILYGQASDGSRTVQRIWQSRSSSGAAYIQTDRPVYRLGQHVNVRAVLRDGTIGSYSVPRGKVHVIVRAPDGTTFLDRERHISQFGTVAMGFDIPESQSLGYYQIIIGNASSNFNVVEYKKPEYLVRAQAEELYVVGGDPLSFAIDAKYFFGRPAAGMTLRTTSYSTYEYYQHFNPYAFLEKASPSDYQPPHTSSATADALGHLRVVVPTKPVRYSRLITLEVEGRDASGRTVTTQAVATVVPASFRIDLTPSRWFAQLGDDVDIAAVTRDYQERSRPNTRLEVEVRGTRWDYRTHVSSALPVERYALVTNAQGRASFHWHPERAASYEVRFLGTDERGNVATSNQWLWVSSASETWWYPGQQITMIPDKAAYRPGERAKILLTVPGGNADAVLIVNTDKIDSARVIHVGSDPQTLLVDPPKDASFYNIRVEVPGKNGLSVGDLGISVTPAPRLLHVSLRAGKAKYAPGERATFYVRVRDANGKPVRADLGLGIVDEALYAVQEDRAASLLGQFYDNRGVYIASAPSWLRVDNEAIAAAPSSLPTPGVLKEIAAVTTRSSRLIKPGVTSDVYAVNGQSAEPPPRSYFPDTAYWNPDILTDTKGNATFAFEWPDTLTTWRATGVAVDLDTNVGTGTQDALVTKDFLVRLEMPRFLRRGDRSQFTGIANGKNASTGATLRLDAGDLPAGGTAQQSIAMDDNATGNATWIVQPLTSLGNRDITLRGSDGMLTDALRLSIPIEAAGATEHVRDAGEAHSRNTVALSLPALYDPGSLRVNLSPSVVAQLLQNVRLLDVYPYYCTEQTMSAALPAVFLERTFKRTGLTFPADSLQTSSVVKKALKRLQELQHGDGSWGWWERDDAHPFMTAYALYGLAEFRKSGYAVENAMYARGVAALRGQLAAANDDTLRLWGGRQAGSQWNTRAFMLFALADAAPGSIDSGMLEQTMQHASQLNDYALAVLGLAQHELGNDAAARVVLDRLNRHMLQDGAYAYWLGQTWHYAWQDDPIETTAYALRLNDVLDGRTPRTEAIVNFLLRQQRGSWWYTTKDTAAAVYAIAETDMPSPQELRPDETVDVFVNQKLVRHLHVTKAVFEQTDASFSVPAGEFKDGATVRFEVKGPGSLYWSTDWTRFTPPFARKVADAQESILARLNAKSPSFSIDRKYEAKRWPWQTGDEITVDTTVRSDSAVDYVAIEDPFPAGVEYAPMQGAAGNDWSGLQFFDDRVVFFADRLYAGSPLHLQYTLRVTTPGTYTAPAPTAYAMYGPPVSSVGEPDRITIR